MNANSIGINNWSKGQCVEMAGHSGEGESRIIGWVRADGARAIETNGDPVFESEDGFEEAWSSLSA